MTKWVNALLFFPILAFSDVKYETESSQEKIVKNLEIQNQKLEVQNQHLDKINKGLTKANEILDKIFRALHPYAFDQNGNFLKEEE